MYNRELNIILQITLLSNFSLNVLNVSFYTRFVFPSYCTICLGHSIYHEFKGNRITLILVYKYKDLHFLTFKSDYNDNNITYMFYRESSYSQLCSLRYRFRSHSHKNFVNNVHRFHCNYVHIYQAHLLQITYKSMN